VKGTCEQTNNKVMYSRTIQR